MTADRNTAVGAFVVGGVVLAVGALVLFGQFSLFNPAIHAAIVFQNSIAGLSVGSPVTFRGVRVGAVDGITIRFDAKNGTALIPVTVRLDPGRALVVPEGRPARPDLSGLIARGLRAELNVQSFVTGQSEIDLDFDPGSTSVTHPNVTSLPEIPTRQSTLQRARDELSKLPLRELADNATATMVSLRTLTEKLDQDLPPLVASLKATSDQSADAVAAAKGTIQDLQNRLDTTLDAITAVAATGDRQLNQRGAQLQTLLTASNDSMSQVRGMLADLQGITSPRGQTRANLESVLRDLAAATASLRGFAGDIERNPQLLLTGRQP